MMIMDTETEVVGGGVIDEMVSIMFMVYCDEHRRILVD